MKDLLNAFRLVIFYHQSLAPQILLGACWSSDQAEVFLETVWLWSEPLLHSRFQSLYTWKIINYPSVDFLVLLGMRIYTDMLINSIRVHWFHWKNCCLAIILSLDGHCCTPLKCSEKKSAKYCNSLLVHLQSPSPWTTCAIMWPRSSMSPCLGATCSLWKNKSLFTQKREEGEIVNDVRNYK